MIQYFLLFVLSAFADGEIYPHGKFMDCHSTNECKSNDVCAIEVYVSFEAEWTTETEVVNGTLTWQQGDDGTKISMPALIVRTADRFLISNVTSFPPERRLDVTVSENSKGEGVLGMERGKTHSYSCKRFSNPK